MEPDYTFCPLFRAQAVRLTLELTANIDTAERRQEWQREQAENFQGAMRFAASPEQQQDIVQRAQAEATLNAPIIKPEPDCTNILMLDDDWMLEACRCIFGRCATWNEKAGQCGLVGLVELGNG